MSERGAITTARLEAFSDGVLAVDITLLVLEVKVPAGLKSDAELWGAIWGLGPVLAAWAVSFAFILTFWVSHHYFCASLRHADRGVLWLNGAFLFFITLIPFPTALVGQYPGLAAPLALLSAVMMLTSLSFTGLRLYATFAARLLHAHIDERRARRAMLQSMLAPLLYALAAAFAFVWPVAAIAIQVLVLVMFVLRPPSRRHVSEPGRMDEDVRS